MSQTQQTSSIDDLRAQVSRMLDRLDPNTPIAATVVFKVDRAKESTFIRNADVLTAATRKLPGVKVFAYQKYISLQAEYDPVDTLEYLIYEDWESRDLFRTQWNSEHLTHFQYTVGDLIVAPPDLRFYYGWDRVRIKTRVTESGERPSMRELTKTAFGFSWSLSLFGVQQLANLLKLPKAADAFDNVSRTMEQELDGVLHRAFKSGDALQRGVVDLALGGLPGQAPERTSSIRMAADTRKPNVTPSAAQLRVTGWGPVPYAVTIPDSIRAPLCESSHQAAISGDYQFEPHYLAVHGSTMHYVDVGSGDPILILHGNPTWSYIWRNIIPHLAPLGRCIAPDLIGFGRSDKPHIEYHWFDHVRYLEAFIDQLGLRNITLLLHDHGSGLGFQYAMRHENNVKGIAFFEAIIRPYTWDQFSTPEFRELFRRFRTGDVGGEGWQMIVEQNMFIEQLLPQAAGRPLTEKEMSYYREPFKDPMSRLPIWRFPRETPIGGEPQDVWDAVTIYSRRLQKSALPKLLLYAKPGALVTAEHLDWAKQNIDNLETIYLGEGSHFLQESSPHQIGTEVARWISGLNGHHRSHDQKASRKKASDERPASRLPSSIPPSTSTPGISAEVMQHLVDQAAYFNLFSLPDSTRSGAAIRGANGAIGVDVDEVLHRFQVTIQAPTATTPFQGSNVVGESIGKFRHRWLVAPDDFIALPARVPPQTPLDPTRPQRFVMLDGMCTFGDGTDGFRGFGTGQTLPTMVDGHPQLLATAVGTIVEGFGKFERHQEGTYIYCGTLDPDDGFKGNVMLRVMDPQKTLHTGGPIPSLRTHFDSEEGITYVVIRGEAVPSDPVSPNIGPDGKQIGLIVEQGLKLQYIDSTTDGQWGVRAIDRVGQSIGRLTAYVTFDPAYASGTALDPVPFTAYDELVFISRDGEAVGTITADSSEGRLFNVTLSGQSAIRFGATGHIRGGTGPFQGIDGLMTDNSLVVFSPHVSASIYILRINDRGGRFRDTLGAL